MPTFVFEANIAHYKERIAKESDPEMLKTLRRLLAEEEDKLAEYKANHPTPKHKRA